eukprot:3402054-Amphidinium_carterae.1
MLSARNVCEVAVSDNGTVVVDSGEIVVRCGLVHQVRLCHPVCGVVVVEVVVVARCALRQLQASAVASCGGVVLKRGVNAQVAVNDDGDNGRFCDATQYLSHVQQSGVEGGGHGVGCETKLSHNQYIFVTV